MGGIGEETGGYKGYGYATVVEILSAALQAGSYMKMLTGRNENGNKQPYHLGHFFIVMDTEAFLGSDSFKKHAETFYVSYEAHKDLPGMTVYILPVKKSISVGSNGKIQVFL